MFVWGFVEFVIVLIYWVLIVCGGDWCLFFRSGWINWWWVVVENFGFLCFVLSVNVNLMFILLSK